MSLSGAACWLPESVDTDDEIRDFMAPNTATLASGGVTRAACWLPEAGYLTDGNESEIVDDEIRDLMAPNAADLATLTNGVTDLATLTTMGMDMLLSSSCDDPLQIESFQLPPSDEGEDAPQRSQRSQQQQQKQLVTTARTSSLRRRITHPQQQQQKQPHRKTPRRLDRLVVQMSRAAVRGYAQATSPELALVEDFCAKAFAHHEDKLSRLYTSLEHINDIYKELAAQVDNHEEQLAALHAEIVTNQDLGNTTSATAASDEQTMQKRHLELIRINRSMQQISDMYSDLDSLVRSHQQQIEALEDDIRSTAESTMKDPPKCVSFLCMDGKEGAMCSGAAAAAEQSTTHDAGLRVDEDFYWSMPLETMFEDMNAVSEDIVGVGRDVMSRASDGVECCVDESAKIGEGCVQGLDGSSWYRLNKDHYSAQPSITT